MAVFITRQNRQIQNIDPEDKSPGHESDEAIGENDGKGGVDHRVDEDRDRRQTENQVAEDDQSEIEQSAGDPPRSKAFGGNRLIHTDKGYHQVQEVAIPR